MTCSFCLEGFPVEGGVHLVSAGAVLCVGDPKPEAARAVVVDRERLEAERLAAEFHSPLNRGNLRRKLKRGRGPVQLGMFEPAPEPEAQQELF